MALLIYLIGSNNAIQLAIIYVLNNKKNIPSKIKDRQIDKFYVAFLRIMEKKYVYIQFYYVG